MSVCSIFRSVVAMPALLIGTQCIYVPPPSKVVVVRLDDVQGIAGGQSLALDVDGNLFVRKVENQKEKSYYQKMSQTECVQLQKFIQASGIYRYIEKPRQGVPDEARHRISFSYPNAERFVAEKWANDSDAQFEVVYRKLLFLVEQCTLDRPFRRRSFDFKTEFP